VGVLAVANDPSRDWILGEPRTRQLRAGCVDGTHGRPCLLVLFVFSGERVFVSGHSVLGVMVRIKKGVSDRSFGFLRCAPSSMQSAAIVSVS
jgi:hypothetical protein